MTALWALAITAADSDGRYDFIEAARQGESLLQALGGNIPAASARTFSPDAGYAAWDTWSDRYAESAERVRAMPLGVLFAGLSGWDPRADRVVQALTQTPPTWPELRAIAEGKILPAGVGPSFDWYASHDEAGERGNESQIAQSRVHRAWWSEALTRWEARPGRPTPGRPPTPIRPPSPGSGSGSSAVFLLLAGLVLAWRRKRGK